MYSGADEASIRKITFAKTIIPPLLRSHSRFLFRKILLIPAGPRLDSIPGGHRSPFSSRRGSPRAATTPFIAPIEDLRCPHPMAVSPRDKRDPFERSNILETNNTIVSVGLAANSDASVAVDRGEHRFLLASLRAQVRGGS